MLIAGKNVSIRLLGSLISLIVIFVPYFGLSMWNKDDHSIAFSYILTLPEMYSALRLEEMLYLALPLMGVAILTFIVNITSGNAALFRKKILPVILSIIAAALFILWAYATDQVLDGTFGSGWYVMGLGLIGLVVFAVIDFDGRASDAA